MSAKNSCLKDLRDRILSMDLRPGENLDETNLSEHYGISRTPLREVLQRLAGEGYLTQSNNRGTFVSSMDLDTLRVFFQTAPLVYANISKMAAENGTPDQISRLKDIQYRFTKASKNNDPATAVMRNFDFHELIGEMSANVYLNAALGRMLIDHTRLSQTFYRPENPTEDALVAQACDHHDQMIAAFEARDADRAIDLTLEHWDLSKGSMERFVQPAPLPIGLNAKKDLSHAI